MYPIQTLIISDYPFNCIWKYTYAKYIYGYVMLKYNTLNNSTFLKLILKDYSAYICKFTVLTTVLLRSIYLLLLHRLSSTLHLKATLHLNEMRNIKYHRLNTKDCWADLQYSPDNLTLANSHVPDNSHNHLRHNSAPLTANVKLPF